MSTAAVDAVIVGSGPNGLAAAITLAQHGLSVTVLEAADEIGGGTRTKELTVPGVLHDVCAAVHPFGVASPFLVSLPLAEHGLRWRWPEIDLAHPLDDGSAGVLWQSLDATADRLGRDGKAWRRTFAPLVAGFDELAPRCTGADGADPDAPAADGRLRVTRRTSGDRDEPSVRHRARAGLVHRVRGAHPPAVESPGNRVGGHDDDCGRTPARLAGRRGRDPRNHRCVG
jgi:phytoene dehydrogenase-like protein